MVTLKDHINESMNILVTPKSRDKFKAKCFKNLAIDDEIFLGLGNKDNFKVHKLLITNSNKYNFEYMDESGSTDDFLAYKKRNKNNIIVDEEDFFATGTMISNGTSMEKYFCIYSTTIITEKDFEKVDHLL